MEVITKSFTCWKDTRKPFNLNHLTPSLRHPLQELIPKVALIGDQLRRLDLQHLYLLEIRKHGRRMIPPDNQLFNIGRLTTKLTSKLVLGSVLVKSCLSREVLPGDLITVACKNVA